MKTRKHVMSLFLISTLVSAPSKACQDESFCSNLKSFCHLEQVKDWCKNMCGVCPETTVAPTQEPCTDSYDICGSYSNLCGHNSWMEDNCKKTCSLCGENAWSSCTKTCGGGTSHRLQCDANGNCETVFKECATLRCPAATCEKPKYDTRYGIDHSCCTITQSHCGQSFITQSNPSVFGGENAIQKRWPWAVAISIPKGDFCSGVLINNLYILSAAHCFTDTDNNPVDTSKYEIVLGILKLSDKGKKRKIKKVNIHPQYSFPKHDIAVIEINKRVKFSSKIQPICLPSGEETPIDTKCYVTGWGSSETSPFSTTNHLQEAGLQNLDRRVCESAYAKNPLNQPFMPLLQSKKDYLCAGSLTKTIDSCGGDSGGALVCQRCSSCNWYAAGIVSFGTVQCATVGIPGVYTEVRTHESWISSITGITQAAHTCPNKFGP